MHELADAYGSHRLVVLRLAYTGCQFGEMAALRVGRLDLMRRRANIAAVASIRLWVAVDGQPAAVAAIHSSSRRMDAPRRR